MLWEFEKLHIKRMMTFLFINRPWQRKRRREPVTQTNRELPWRPVSPFFIWGEGENPHHGGRQGTSLQLTLGMILFFLCLHCIMPDSFIIGSFSTLRFGNIYAILKKNVWCLAGNDVKLVNAINLRSVTETCWFPPGVAPICSLYCCSMTQTYPIVCVFWGNNGFLLDVVAALHC